METLQVFTNVPWRAHSLGDLCNVPLEMEILQIVHKLTRGLMRANLWRQYLSLAKICFVTTLFINSSNNSKSSQAGSMVTDIFIRKIDADLEVKMLYLQLLFLTVQS